MATTTLVQVGNTVMVEVPAETLELLKQPVGTEVDIQVERGTLLLGGRRRTKYNMEDLLAQCDFSIPQSQEDQEWLDLESVGREL